MPHQCLSCGEVFEDGSTDLLKGCPGCEGTRFFYTAEPLGDAARSELQKKAETDVRTMLEEVLKSGERRDLSKDIWSKEAWEKWVRFDAGPKGLEITDLPEEEPTAAPKRPAVQVSLDEVEEQEPPEPVAAPEAVPEPPLREGRPSTLNIVEPGSYEIDVERLMEDSPVIVERDGSYLIHLPSVFAKAGGKKRR